MTWISVSDQMPPYKGMYKVKKEPFKAIYHASYDGKNFKTSWVDIEPTHWLKTEV